MLYWPTINSTVSYRWKLGNTPNSSWHRVMASDSAHNAQVLPPPGTTDIARIVIINSVSPIPQVPVTSGLTVMWNCWEVHQTVDGSMWRAARWPPSVFQDQRGGRRAASIRKYEPYASQMYPTRGLTVISFEWNTERGRTRATTPSGLLQLCWAALKRLTVTVTTVSSDKK